MQSVAIIGIGRVGGALALALSDEGYAVNKLFSRHESIAKKIAGRIDCVADVLSPADFSRISEEIVFITTQDFEISGVVESLLDSLQIGSRFIFHTSGSLSSDVLGKLAERGNKTASIHPLVSISDSVLGAARFRDAYFCVEGDPGATLLAKKIVTDLGGKPFSIVTGKKALYHASAVTACGHFVSLIDVATRMLSECGLSKLEAKEVLMPLVESTVENLKEQSTAEALTGTFARGDVHTLERHIDALEKNVSGDDREIYIQLGKRSLELARERGVSTARISKMRAKLRDAERNLGDSFHADRKTPLA